MKLTLYFNALGIGHLDKQYSQPVVCCDAVLGFFGRVFSGKQVFSVSTKPSKKKGEKILHFRLGYPIVNGETRGFYLDFNLLMCEFGRPNKLYIRHLS